MPTDLDADYVFTNKKIITTPNNEFDRLFLMLDGRFVNVMSDILYI